jgi:hypothetical protein
MRGGNTKKGEAMRGGDGTGRHATYQLRTRALTRSSSPFREMLCCMRDSISTMSVR